MIVMMMMMIMIMMMMMMMAMAMAMAMVMVMMRRTVMIGWWSGDDDFSNVDLGGNGYHDADHEDDRDDDHDDEVVVFTGAASFEWSVVMWTAVVFLFSIHATDIS